MTTGLEMLKEIKQFIDIHVAFVKTVCPILERCYEAKLISPVEMAEIEVQFAEIVAWVERCRP